MRGGVCLFFFRREVAFISDSNVAQWLEHGLIYPMDARSSRAITANLFNRVPMSIQLFVDIETAPIVKTFAELSPDGQAAFKKKFQARVDKMEFVDLEAAFQKEAGLLAEFAKIICIGLGSIVRDSANNGNEKIYLKALIGPEPEILQEFKAIVERTEPDLLVGHRAKEFDFPFIGRRMLINSIRLPAILNVFGQKPWDVPWGDTAELWSFTDRKYYVSLITLAFVFGIPSPKTSIDGSMVAAAFYAGKIDEIKTYCLGDVLTEIKIYRRIKGLQDIQGVIYSSK